MAAVKRDSYAAMCLVAGLLAGLLYKVGSWLLPKAMGALKMSGAA